MTPSEFYTTQFYTWEYRGRGWHLEDVPIQLEPPYIPYIRHMPALPYIDDGKRHTLVSKAIEWFRGKKEVIQEDTPLLDYEQLEIFPFDDDSPLQALQIKVPKERNVTPERMKALVTMLSYGTSPVSFEIIGNAKEIILQFVCRHHQTYILEANIKAYFPEYTIIQSDAYLEDILQGDKSIVLTDFGLRQELFQPLPISKNFTIDPLAALFGALESLKTNQHGGIQILFCGTFNPWSGNIKHSVIMPDGSSFFINMEEAPKLALEKVASPLFGICIRAFGQADTIEESQRVFDAISYSLLNASAGHTNSLLSMPTEIYDVDARVNDIYFRQSHRLGMLLNADELVHLLHFPSASIQSRKLFSSNRKTKEVPSIARGKAFVIGSNGHNGIEEKVTIGIDQRLRHMHIIGATGTGKSTLIANLIIQDCQSGLGLVLFDPHGDLVDDVIAHIPEERLTDIVLIDPSDTEYPVGLNILEAHNDIEKEILSSDLVASFRKLSTSWGDQMNAVFGNAILAMLESREGGTLHDLRRFLIEKDYRNKFLQTVQDPSVLYYWHKEFPLLKTNSVGPILTRLNTFLRPRTIRNIIIQKTGLDFENLINTNKIILVKLSQGLIGTENSYLLGSVILSKIHQAAFARQSKTIRNPFFIYLDEFQNFITPSIKEMIGGIRKYNVGLILSHQDLQQLQREDGELLNSVLGNSNTRIVFRVGEPDAKRLQDGFSSFDFTDLQNLGKGEAIIRIEQPQYDCSLDTIPLKNIRSDESQNNKEAVIEYSRNHYAVPRSIIEQSLYESYDLDATDNREKEAESKKQPPQQEAPKAGEVHKESDIRGAIEHTQPAEEKDISTHRYLQTLVKKMAEARGYTATIEMQLPDGSGQVDVLLAKEGKTVAVEICYTTDPDWEMHNILKCIHAGYTHIVSLSGDIKQLEKIKKKCFTGIADFETQPVLFFTPDALFSFLDESVKEQVPEEVTMKGYRVNVSYDAITNEEMGRKRASVANVIFNTLRKHKKKEY